MAGRRARGWLCLSLAAAFAGCAGGGQGSQGFAPVDDAGGGDSSSSGVDGTASSSGGADSGAATHDGGADSGGDSATTGSSGGDGAVVGEAGGDAGGDAATGDGSAEGGGGALGAACVTNADCASMECIKVFPGYSVCATPCTQQADCGSGSMYFCDPTSAGASSGYCVPRSPAHCLSCNVDSDCGSLSEVCVQLPGDTAKACHIDCNLSQASACPPDYSCGSYTVGGSLRYLCAPNATPVCNDSLGGYCERVSLPQPCSRTNPAGTCTGERLCLTGSERFDKCGAPAPQCKSDCSQQDPAGCMESFCGTATSGPANCGSCGNVCPGYQKTNDVVTCDATQKCTFGCAGENYDVNNDPTDGCEVAHSPVGAHTTGTATSDGTFPCTDSASNPNITGALESDRVTHTPAITGFVAGNGSAPDVWVVYGSGGLTCVDDYSITLTISNSTNPACYQLLFQTDKVQANCSAANYSCNVSGGSGSYTDGSDIYFTVQKICSLPFDESVGYTITGHL